MYTHCIFCVAPLRTNTDLESLPVGRQVAFDEQRGRLWVVCPGCGRWNLTPIDTRWETIEASARLFRQARLRASTSQIGLARLAGGLELIRIGAPDDHEMAAWRYGRVFAARQRRAYVTAGSLAVVAAATLSLQHLAPAASSALPFAALLPQLGSLLTMYRATAQPIARVTDELGRTTLVRGTSVSSIRLVPTPAAPDGWTLHLPARDTPVVLSGDDASRTLGRILAHTNRVGGGPRVVRDAVRPLEERGAGTRFLLDYASRHRGEVADPMARTRHAEWLALEMALHEESERVALRGDLAALEAAWREAEELAAIADGLLVPSTLLHRVR